MELMSILVFAVFFFAIAKSIGRWIENENSPILTISATIVDMRRKNTPPSQQRTGAYGSGNNIITGMTIFSAVLVHRYVCCDCGYSEEWIDKEDINKLKESF